MFDSATIVGMQADLLEHPAVKAWGEIGLTKIEPRSVVVLKPEKKRSAVYRLEGVGPADSPVIAKRGRLDRIAVELTIYREVLPRLPARCLRCYGFVQDRDPGFAWLFLEDAGDEKYSTGSLEHRALAARWLGSLHISTAGQPAEAGLPDRGPQYYREVVSLASDTIRRSLTNRALSSSDLGILNRLLSHCETVASHWRQVEEI